MTTEFNQKKLHLMCEFRLDIRLQFLFEIFFSFFLAIQKISALQLQLGKCSVDPKITLH